MRSTFPVQGTLIILIVSGYLRRIEPARSAAVYPQKLQQNVTITGRNSSIKKLLPKPHMLCFVNLTKSIEPINSEYPFKQCIYFGQDLVIFVPVQLYGLGRTFGSANPAAVA